MLPVPSDGLLEWSVARMPPDMAAAVRLGAKPTIIVVGFRGRERGVDVRLAVRLGRDRVSLPLVSYGRAHIMLNTARVRLGWRQAGENDKRMANWRGLTPCV